MMKMKSLVVELLAVCGAFFLTSVFANPAPLRLKVYEKEIRTSSHLGVQLFCDIQRPKGSALHCSTVSWTRSDVTDDYKEGDENSDDVSDATETDNYVEETYTVRAKVSVHMFAEVTQNASRQDLLRAEEHIKGRYSCSVTCASQTYTVSCTVTQFKHQDRAFLCSEKSFTDVPPESLKHSHENQQHSSTDVDNKDQDRDNDDDLNKNKDRNNSDGDDDNDDTAPPTTTTTISINQQPDLPNIGKITNLRPPRSGDTVVIEPGTAPRVMVGLAIIVSCFFCIGSVLLYRCYSKYRKSPKLSWSRSVGNPTPLPEDESQMEQGEDGSDSEEQEGLNEEEQREFELDDNQQQWNPCREIRQHGRRQRRRNFEQGHLACYEHSRHHCRHPQPNRPEIRDVEDMLSFVSFRRLLARSQSSSSSRSRHQQRSPIFLGDNRSTNTGQRSSRNTSGLRYDLLQPATSGACGSRGAVWCSDSEEAVVIFMPDIGEMTAAKLPSYEDAMAEARQESRDRTHSRHHEEYSPSSGEQRRLLLHDNVEEDDSEGEEGSSRASSDLTQYCSYYSPDADAPPLSYQRSEASRHDVSSESDDNSSSGSDDVVNISRPPSYHSLNAEASTGADMQFVEEQS